MDSSSTGRSLRTAALDKPAGDSGTAVAVKGPTSPRPFAIRYGIALVLVATSLFASLGMQRMFAFPYPFLFLFFGAVMVSAWFGGTGAGLFAVLLSTVVVDYFFVPPFYSWLISTTAETYFVAFVLCALVASWISSAKKRSEEALQEARDQLEIKVSERTSALMQTQAELTRLSRALSLGEVTGSIAHEINQPLTAVVTNGDACLQWLSTNPPNLEKARQSVEKIIQDGTRAGTVVSRIRSLFRNEQPTKNRVDINEVIQELIEFLRHEAFTRHISLCTQLSQHVPAVKADRVQLQQVVLNLVMNAMDAVTEANARQRTIVIGSRIENGQEVLVSVEDTGTGLNPQTAAKIFEPFFTTKPHGIGVGLSVSRSIVEAHEGRLWVIPNPAGGAIFQFTLPTGQEGHE
jgi:C4-dicarboxylate-specific signal transduction histidine kinase